MSELFKDSYKSPSETVVALSVYNTGRQKCAPAYCWGPGIRDHYLIHYIIAGQGYYETPQGRYDLEAGDVFLAYPGVPITYGASDTDPWEYCWVGFSGSDATAILAATSFTPQAPIIKSHPCGSMLSKRLMDIYESRGSSFSSTVEMTGRLYAALALLIRDTPSNELGSGPSPYVQRAVEYIHGHYAYPISIEDIADYTGISRSQLYRVFLSVLNQSPKEYLTDFRIRQACRLLKTTKLSMNTIAGSVGFENGLYFSKVFHKIRGISPSAYRQKHT